MSGLQRWAAIRQQTARGHLGAPGGAGVETRRVGWQGGGGEREGSRAGPEGRQCASAAALPVDGAS